MAKRGMLTDAIKAKAVECLGREIDQIELRLMAHVQYCLVNGKNIEPVRVNGEERQRLMEWQANDWIADPASDLTTTKHFWDAMHEILWLGYVIVDMENGDALTHL